MDNNNNININVNIIQDPLDYVSAFSNIVETVDLPFDSQATTVAVSYTPNLCPRVFTTPTSVVYQPNVGLPHSPLTMETIPGGTGLSLLYSGPGQESPIVNPRIPPVVNLANPTDPLVDNLTDEESFQDEKPQAHVEKGSG